MTDTLVKRICPDDDMPSIERIAEVAVPGILANDTQNVLSGVLGEPNPYLAVAGMFAGDPFADEVAAYIEQERRRERDEAAQ